jgi:hypothetical protein
MLKLSSDGNDPYTNGLLALALAAGVKDESYPVGRHGGRIPSYSGVALITAEDDRRWWCIGHRSKGRADTCTRVGRVEFMEIGSPQEVAADLVGEHGKDAAWNTAAGCVQRSGDGTPAYAYWGSVLEAMRATG